MVRPYSPARLTMLHPRARAYGSSSTLCIVGTLWVPPGAWKRVLRVWSGTKGSVQSIFTHSALTRAIRTSGWTVPGGNSSSMMPRVTSETRRLIAVRTPSGSPAKSSLAISAPTRARTRSVNSGRTCRSFRRYRPLRAARSSPSSGVAAVSSTSNWSSGCGPSRRSSSSRVRSRAPVANRASTEATEYGDHTCEVCGLLTAWSTAVAKARWSGFGGVLSCMRAPSLAGGGTSVRKGSLFLSESCSPGPGKEEVRKKVAPKAEESRQQGCVGSDVATHSW